jgi:hypothetical protein
MRDERLRRVFPLPIYRIQQGQGLAARLVFCFIMVG